MLEKLVTVLVPTRNRPRTLKVTLSSIRDCVGARTRTIIGDNGNAEVTGKLLRENNDFGLDIVHLKNPSGYTYDKNLSLLLAAPKTDWLCVLHDDDFFVGRFQVPITNVLSLESVDFVFSDHWVASDLGIIDENLSYESSVHYGRDKLTEGRVSDLEACVISQSVCLDGYFVRTPVVQAIAVDLSLAPLADSRLMLDIAHKTNGRGWYIRDRLFAYRLSEVSGTARGIDQILLYKILKETRPISDRSKWLLRRRRRRQLWYAMRYSVKRLRILDLLRAIS